MSDCDLYAVVGVDCDEHAAEWPTFEVSRIVEGSAEGPAYSMCQAHVGEAAAYLTREDDDPACVHVFVVRK